METPNSPGNINANENVKINNLENGEESNLQQAQNQQLNDLSQMDKSRMESQINFEAPSATLDNQPESLTTLVKNNVASPASSPVPNQMHSQTQLQQTPGTQICPPQIEPLLSEDPIIEILANNVSKQDQMITKSPDSPQKTLVTKVRLADELNVFYWTKTKEIISHIAEKAKNSVDSVITTLDPGMKEYLYSGGNVNIIVVCDSNWLVSPIRDAFQSAFGRATVSPASYSPPSTKNDYPIGVACGFQEAVIVAREKIKILRQYTNNIPQNQVVVVVQPALVEVINDNKEIISNDKISSNWFATYCMLIEDPVLSLAMKCFSQLIPVDLDVIESAKLAKYPDQFQDKHLGFAVSLNELMSKKLKTDTTQELGDEYGCNWLRDWAGVYETQLVHQLSLTLAKSYGREWNACARMD